MHTCRYQSYTLKKQTQPFLGAVSGMTTAQMSNNKAQVRDKRVRVYKHSKLAMLQANNFRHLHAVMPYLTPSLWCCRNMGGAAERHLPQISSR